MNRKENKIFKTEGLTEIMVAEFTVEIQHCSLITNLSGDSVFYSIQQPVKLSDVTPMTPFFLQYMKVFQDSS